VREKRSGSGIFVPYPKLYLTFLKRKSLQLLPIFRKNCPIRLSLHTIGTYFLRKYSLPYNRGARKRKRKKKNTVFEKRIIVKQREQNMCGHYKG
jgi:hypothetical protein